jgi:hypothetical protein
MTQKKANPARRCRGGGAEKARLANKQRTDSRSKSKKRKARYWLHVDAHGVEHRFKRQPKTRPSLRVTVHGDHEITCTRLIWTGTGECSGYKPIWPRGYGWDIACLEPEGAYWVREVRS